MSPTHASLKHFELDSVAHAIVWCCVSGTKSVVCLLIVVPSPASQLPSPWPQVWCSPRACPTSWAFNPPDKSAVRKIAGVVGAQVPDSNARGQTSSLHSSGVEEPIFPHYRPE